MSKMSETMKRGVKDTMAVIISETTGAEQGAVRDWLDTVNTAEEFFGNNQIGLKEYNNFIAAKEAEYARAKRNSSKRI